MADPLRATFVSQGAKVHFIAVGTPQQRDGHVADLTYVNAAIDGLVPHLSAGDVVAGKSTVPVGIAAELAPRVEPTGATLVWNPEFLREGRCGTLYGMVKTTLYLPDDLKRAIEIEAARQGASEAEVIRATLRQGLERSTRKPRGAVFAGTEPIADRADELLAGFGE